MHPLPSPAAMVGFANALTALSHHRSGALMNLRSLNLHITAILQPAARGFALPRQDAQAPLSGSAAQGLESVQGLSSFAFQGTNAHAVLCNLPHSAGPALPASHKATAALWRRSRFWFVPHMHTLLHRCTVAAPGIQTMEMQLSTELARSSLAYLQDHQIRGRVLLPGAAMFEMAASVGRVLARLGDAGLPAILNVGLSVPLVLLPGIGGTLICSAICATGRLHIRSAQEGPSGVQQLHASAAAGRWKHSSFYMHTHTRLHAQARGQHIWTLHLHADHGWHACMLSPLKSC